MKVSLLPRAHYPGMCWAYVEDDEKPDLSIEVINAEQALDRGLYRDGKLLDFTPQSKP